MFVTKEEGSRRRGRPRFISLEGVEENLRSMKAKRRRQKAVDREKGASIVKKGKAYGSIHPHVSQAVYSLYECQIKS